MRNPKLFIALLLFALQAFAATDELNASPQNSMHFLDRFGFKELLDASYDRNDPTKTVANLFAYYIDGRVFSNIVEALFSQADTDFTSLVTEQQFYTLTDAEGVHRLDAQRVFYLVQSDADATTLDFFEFSNFAEILLDESMTIITFAYIVGGPQHSQDVTIDLQTLETNLLRIFQKVPSIYPAPRCEELEYLFEQSDINQDGKLDIQEFHYLLGVFLRYYKSGVQNNRYASLVFNDEMFQDLWIKESGLGGHLDKTKFLRLSFLRFLQVSIYDKILNQVSHVLFTKFDTDGNGNISQDEFKVLLSLFRAPEKEMDLLFATADSDHSGAIDFAEFVVTIETFLRRLIADFGYYFLTESNLQTDVDSTYGLMQNATGYLNLEFLPKDKFTDIFNGVDADGNQILDKDEFSTFISEIIAFLRTKIRLQEEAEITQVAGMNATSATIAQAVVVKEEGLSERANEVTSDLLANDNQIATEVVQAITAGTPLSTTAEENGGVSPEEIGQSARMTEAIEEVYSAKEEADAEAEADDQAATEAPAVTAKTDADSTRIVDVISSSLTVTPEPPVTPDPDTFIIPETTETEATTTEAVPTETTTTVETATTEEVAPETTATEATTTEATATETTTTETTTTEEAAPETTTTETTTTETTTEAAAPEATAAETTTTETTTEAAAPEATATEATTTEVTTTEATTTEAEATPAL